MDKARQFSTLIHIILEQQVSLASAKAAFVKLKEKMGTITPKKLFLLTDAELRACYFSRQKMSYAKTFGRSYCVKTIESEKLSLLSDEKIRKELKK